MVNCLIFSGFEFNHFSMSLKTDALFRRVLQSKGVMAGFSGLFCSFVNIWLTSVPTTKRGAAGGRGPLAWRPIME
jgi:hypothetical protein